MQSDEGKLSFMSRKTELHPAPSSLNFENFPAHSVMLSLRIARMTAREFHIAKKPITSPFRNIPSLGVIEGTEQDADDVDDLPDNINVTVRDLGDTFSSMFIR